VEEILSIWLDLLFILLLVIANGFFACSELAIISARKSKVAQLVSLGNYKARLVQKLQNDPHRFLATVQVGMTLVGSTASAVGGAVAVEFLKPTLMMAPFKFIRDAAAPLSLTFAVILVSYLLLVLGELVPKTLGLQYADTISLSVANPINLLAHAGVLAIGLLTLSSKAVLALMGVRREGMQAFITKDEVRHIVAEGEKTGVFSPIEHEFIQNIFDFTHTCVREVMVPRTRIVGLDLELTKEEIVKAVLEHMYSRYPVYRGSVENIAGFIHGKDLLGRIVKEPDFELNTIVRPPFYVPEGKKVNDLLKEMQRKRIHMALVVDEYGGISGLVTTEDLLEELVGEIEDEHDVGEPRRIQRLADGSLIVDALLSISDLEDVLGIKFGEDLPYDTLAGFILDKLGRFPEKGERLALDSFVVICEEVKKTSIVKVRIMKAEEK
jgi:putative hemolysin